MFSKAGNFLGFVFLFVLVACAQNEPPQNKGLPTMTLQSNPAFTSSKSYPEPNQSITAVPSDTSIKQPTNTALSVSSISPTITVQAPTPSRVSRIQMFGLKNGWAEDSYPSLRSGYDKILRTVDGIKSWEDVTPPITKGGDSAVTGFFIDSNTAVAIHRQQLQPTSFDVEVTAWRTNDGGQTWLAGDTILSNLGKVERIDVMMLNPDHGWMLGTGTPAMGNASVYFFETRDGGMHWEIVYDVSEHLSDPNVLWIRNYYPYSQHYTFVSDTVGFFSNGRLYSTQDGGRNWLFQPLEPPADLPDIDCTGGDCKYRDTISVPQFMSTEDGVMIRRVYLNSDEVMKSFTYGDPLKQLPEAQYFYFTHDGGQTWVPRPSPVKIGTAAFLDAQRGWLLGKSERDPATTTRFYQTMDGGVTWSQVAADSPLPLGSELQFVDDLNGFAYYPYSASYYFRVFDTRAPTSDQNSPLYRTSDGGRSWETVELQIIP